MFDTVLANPGGYMSFNFDSNNFGVVCFGVVLLLFIVLLVIAIVYSSKRKHRIRQSANQMGFAPENNPGQELLEGLKAAYAPAQLVRITNVSKRAYADELVYLFDCSIRGINLSANSRSEVSTTTGNLGIQSPHLNLPHFVLMARVQLPQFLEGKMGSVIEEGIARMGMSPWQKVPPEFDAKYQLFVDEDPRVETVFTDSVLTKIAGLSPFNARGNGRIIIFNPRGMDQGSQMDDETLLQYVQAAQQLCELLAS
jgi:cbb3-type cytochrome oxidase subunit 3